MDLEWRGNMLRAPLWYSVNRT